MISQLMENLYKFIVITINFLKIHYNNTLKFIQKMVI